MENVFTKATRDFQVQCEELQKKAEVHRMNAEKFIDGQIESLKKQMNDGYDDAVAQFAERFPEYAECAEFLNKSLDQLNEELGRPEQKHPLLINILLMQKFFQKPHDTTMTEIDILEDKHAQFWEDARRYFLYCQISYPWSSARRLLKNDQDTTVQHLVDEIGISKEEVIAANLESVPREDVSEEQLCPRYYVIKDTTRREVVVVIRGTASTKDATTDMIAKTNPFLTGIAHDGIARGAKALFKNVKDDLRTLTDEHYKLVLAGHSLGGGTAHLLLALIIDDGIQKLYDSVECYAVAPPPTYFGDFPADDHGNCKVYSFINDDDIVPRLNTRNMARFIYLMQAVDEAPWDTTTRAKILMDYENVDEKDVPTISKEPCSKKYVNISFPPGEVYHLRSDGIYKETAEKFTGKLEITADCIHNHGVPKYMDSFDATKKRLTPKVDFFTQVQNFFSGNDGSKDKKGKKESGYPSARGSTEE